jgi:hypothetical protein
MSVRGDVASRPWSGTGFEREGLGIRGWVRIAGYMIGLKIEGDGKSGVVFCALCWLVEGMCLVLFYENFTKFISCPNAVCWSVDMPNPLLSSHHLSYQCPDCPRVLRSGRGLTQHHNSAHRKFTPPSDDVDELEDESRQYTYQCHPFLNGRNPFQSIHGFRILITNIAIPCAENGGNLPDPPPPPPAPLPVDGQDPTSWDPFGSWVEFDFAQYHFVEVQSSAGDINTALDMWQVSILKYGDKVPWTSAQDLYNTIDSIQLGDAPWKVYKICYQGPLPAGTPPKWMTETYELCTHNSWLVLHNQLAALEFKGKTNYVPYWQFDGKGRHIWSNLMSADWAWRQAVSLRHILLNLCRRHH